MNIKLVVLQRTSQWWVVSSNAGYRAFESLNVIIDVYKYGMVEIDTFVNRIYSINNWDRFNIYGKSGNPKGYAYTGMRYENLKIRYMHSIIVDIEDWS